MSDKLKIEGLLKDNPQGLSIQDISSRTKLYRHLVKNILSELKGEGKITIRVVGNTKLHYWNFKRKEDE